VDWLAQVSDRIAHDAGLDAAELALSPADAELLLDLAGVAAHRSGARKNAPLLCHVIGRAVARGVPLDVLARTVRAFADGG
jgi:hypothetical protein